VGHLPHAKTDCPLGVIGLRPLGGIGVPDLHFFSPTNPVPRQPPRSRLGLVFVFSFFAVGPANFGSEV